MNNKYGWKINKIGEICEILDNLRKPVTKKDRIKGLYPYYGATGIQDYVENFIFDGSYVLVGEDGARWGANDKCAFIVKGKCWVNNHAHVLKINKNILEEWVVYFLNFKDLDEYISGAVIRKLNQAALRGISIPVPPLPIQHQIVSELDVLSDIITKKKQQLEDLDKLAQATFYDMFGDPVTNEKGLTVKSLGEICEITSSKRIYAEEYQQEGIPFYRSKEIIEKGKKKPISLELFISNERYNEIKNKFGIPEIGDILMTAVGTIGEIWVVDSDTPFYFKDGNIVWLKMNKSNNSTYFLFVLGLLVKEYKTKIANGAAYSALTIVNLKNMNVVFPELEIQNQFASKIESIENQKALINHSIGDVQQLFDYTMDKYFN